MDRLIDRSVCVCSELNFVFERALYETQQHRTWRADCTPVCVHQSTDTLPSSPHLPLVSATAEPQEQAGGKSNSFTLFSMLHPFSISPSVVIHTKLLFTLLMCHTFARDTPVVGHLVLRMQMYLWVFLLTCYTITWTLLHFASHCFAKKAAKTFLPQTIFSKSLCRI